MRTLYVIPGSHPCRSAMLMLEQKRLPYRCVELVPALHPLVLRLHGFTSGGQARVAGAQRPLPLRVADQLATVPALAWEDQRITTNRGIARFLEDRRPDPPLFPGEPELRAEVEAAERWADDTLQMVARRIIFAAAVQSPADMSRFTAHGRMGYLLYRRALARRVLAPIIGRSTFAAGASAGRELIAELPGLLDRIDGWIGAGVLGGAQPNVADFMVAPCLALILYRPDTRPLFEGRPALELVDRLLPEPAG